MEKNDAIVVEDEKRALMEAEEQQQDELIIVKSDVAEQVTLDEGYGDAFERAARCSHAQRLRLLFLAILSGLFFYVVVLPHVPAAIPVELTRAGLRPWQGHRHPGSKGHHPHHHHDHGHPHGHAHHPAGKGHHDGKPCPGRMAHQFAEGFFHNTRVGMEEQRVAAKSSVSERLGGNPSALEKLFERLFLAVPSAEGARESLRSLTSTTHEAGSKADYRTAIEVLQQWGSLLGSPVPEDPAELVFDAGSAESIHYMTSTRDDKQHKHAKPLHPLGSPRVWVDTYSVWLNYPVSSSLTIAKNNETERPYHRAPLTEDVLHKDPTSIDGLPTFHGYSKSGKAKGPLVYGGRCTREDFALLKKKGVKIEGAITLCQYGGLFRGLKVRLSAEHGAVGTLIYTDPKEDGNMTEANGHTAYPDGPARNPSAVQRGSVQAISIYPGDAATPGKPSYRNASRIDPDTADSLPKIPSLPISFRDAVPFLNALSGHGIQSTDLTDSFEGLVPGVPEYWTGPSEDIVEMDNQMTDIADAQDIWNTYALIPGVLEDEIVIVSNHRDAWTFGAGDPSSGTAVVHEMVAGLGALVEKGWRPLRTILLASWDAEEYGLIGSTEAAEDYAAHFRNKAVMFINTDVAVRGSKLKASASPSLKDYIVQAASEIPNPSGNGSTTEMGRVGPLGSGSDFTAYLQNLGIASLDTGYDQDKNDAVYHYHSNYDSFYWMEQFGDPGFARHHAAAQYVGLLTLRAAQSLFLPLNVTSYSEELSYYLEKVVEVNSKSKLDLSGIKEAISGIRHSARKFDAEKRRVEKQLERLLSGKCMARMSSKPPSKELRRVFAHIRHLNRRAKLFETGFLARDEEGLVGRPFYKHLAVAPGRFLGYGATTFPGVTESLTLDEGEGAEKEVERLVKALHRVRRNLDRGDA